MLYSCYLHWIEKTIKTARYKIVYTPFLLLQSLSTQPILWSSHLDTIWTLTNTSENSLSQNNPYFSCTVYHIVTGCGCIMRTYINLRYFPCIMNRDGDQPPTTCICVLPVYIHTWRVADCEEGVSNSQCRMSLVLLDLSPCIYYEWYVMKCNTRRSI